MPNNKPRYSLTVDGKQRTVEADKFNDNVSTFIQDMPDATIRMKDSNGAEKDVKLNDLSDALYTGYQYVTTDKPIYVNTKAPEPEKPQQQVAPKPAVAQQQPTQQSQTAPKPQAPSNEPGLIDKIVGAVNTAIGGQPSDMSLGGMQQGGNLIGSLFQSEKPAQKPAVAKQQPTQPTDGNTEEEKRAIDAAKYQQMVNEQNRNIADYGRYYNKALGEMDKMPQQGGTIYAPVARYQEQLIADWLQKASPAETEKYNSDPNFAQQKNWEIFNQAQQVQDEFYKRKAAEMAHNLVKKVDGDTPDEIQENLREAYFNKSNVYDINKVSNFLRMQGDENDQNPYLYYRRFIQNYYMPAIQNALKEKFKGLTLTAPGLSWDMNDLTGSEGKSYDERWMNADERDAYDALLKLFHSDLDKLDKEGAAAFTKQYGQETSENMILGGREGHAMQVGAGGNALRARNYAADPKKAVDDVLNKLYAENGGANGGATEDMDRQAIGNLLYRNMMKYLVDQRVPKSKWGYVLQGFADSDVGELFKALTKTSYERLLDNLANDKYVRNLNGFSGLLAQGGHEATKFLGDAWEYWLGGKAGKAVTGAIRRRAIAGLTADLTARGIAESEAKNIAIRIANARTKSAAEKAFLHAASGSATLGSAQAISGGLRQGLTPAAGQKKAEIQERRANGETITKEQEDKEIAQANAKAHSVGAVAKSAGGSGLSGAAMGATMGIGSLAGDATSKFLSKYFGDVTSAAGGYLAKLNTNAAAATALGQAEGALTGQQPEGSTGQQFASNLVNFAMLDGMNYAPKVLGGHPIRDFRQWKEYERSMGISEEDQDRMRNLGYGDLMDTVDGLVSDRLRTGNPNAGTELSTQRHAESPQETKVNQGMLNMLADPRIPEELKRKYYAVVTGDTSRQLSPIVASEITQDEDGNTYLVTYNKNGNVVSDRQYRNEQAAKEAQMKIGHEQDENLTEALQQNVFAKDADAVMEEAYNAAAEAYKNGGELNNGQKTLIYLYQNKAQLTKAIQAMASGEALSDADKKLVNLYNAVKNTLYSMDGNIPRIVNDVEEDNGLGTGGLQKARNGHTEKEAKRIANETGEEIVHVGGDVWRTMSEDQAVKDYQKRLYDYINDIHEGTGEDVAEPKGLPGRTEEPTDTQEQPSNPEQPTQPEQTTGEGDVALQRPTQQEAEPGTEQPSQPTDTQQPSQPTNAEQPEQPTQTTQPEGQSQVQTVREQGRQRGLSVESDETQLAQIQEDSDLANKRFNNAFQGNQLGEFRNGLIQAVEDDDEDAIQALFDKYGDRLSTEQKEAAMGLVENGAVQNGIEESITNQTMQYQDARKQELDGISDSTGTITEITLQDGSTVYYKSGDITNQYGGIIVVDGNGDTQQIPVSSIAQVGQPTSAKAILDEDTNNFAQGLQNGYQAMASGASMLPGQETTINVGGQSFHATMETELQDGNIQLRLDDGSPLVLTPDQLQQARKAARDANTTQQLAEAEQQRQMKEREDQYNKGVVGYGEGNPDFSAPKTDARTAAELMHEQDKKAGKASKERLSDIQSERDKLNDQIRNAQWEMSRQQRWLELNGDTYSEEERASKQAIIDGYQQQINEWQQRVRKLGEVRNAYMSNEERRQFQSNRRKTMDDVRKNTELGIKNGGLTPTTPQNGGQPQVEVPDAKTLLEKYATQADANAALSEMRDNVMKSYRDGSVNVLSDVRAQLRDYEEGMSDLSNDELQNLYLQQAGARQAEEAAMQQVQKIKNLQGQLSNIYKERNKAALNEMSPRERRATILSGAKTPEELQQKAHEAYDGSELESRLDDTEPETLEEYVSQNMPTNLNWEGTGSGITQKRGLKQELGLSRGIGRNFDSNGINSLLAPKGQGISVDEAAHALWEGRPSQFEGATTQDMRNTLLDLIANSPNARYIKSLTIRNRINEVEGYEQAAEEQEQWLQQQADEEAKARQAAIDTYNDYLDDTAKDAVPSDEVSDYLSGLYADEIAKAKEEADEQEEAWREYEKEKQSLEPNNNNNGTEREDGTGEDVDSEPKQPTIHAGNGEGEAPLRAEETHKPNAEVQHNAQGRTNAGTEAAPAGSGTTDGGVSLPTVKKGKAVAQQRRTQHVDFATETEQQSKAFEESIPKMTDEELLGYIAQDSPDATKQYHPALGDEYDYRHRDEEQDYYNFYEPMLDEEYSKGGREAVEETYNKAWQDWVNGGYASVEDRTRLSAQINACEDWLSEHDKENSLGATDTPEKVDAERQKVNTEPTEAQKEAGNYKKGHIKVDGYDISIENPKGSVREKKDANGKVLWRTPMHYDYGYIKNTEGTDGDHIDVYLSDNPTEGNVYVVDQVNQSDGSFDEHKVMYGFPSMEAARDAYKSQYEDGWKVGTITEVSREDFKKWVESSKRKTKPFSEYKSVKAEAAKQRPTEPNAPTGGNGVDGTDDHALIDIQENGSKVEGMYYYDTLHEEYVKLGKLKYDETIYPHYGYNTVYGRVNAWAIMNDFRKGKLKTREEVQKLQALDKGAAAQQRPTELSSPTGTNGTDRSHWENGADGKKLESVEDVLDEVETRQNIAKYATMKADELRKREPDELRTLERKELAQADTNEQLAKIAKGEKQEKLLKDAKVHRANGELAGRIRQEVKAEREQLMEHRSNERKAQLTKREAALRNGVNELMREAGIEVIDDEKEGQRVLDMANGARLSKDKKRALETASPNLNGTDHQTVIPSADGAKVLKNLDTLVNDFENLSNSPKFFIGSLARALGAQKHGSNSEYATFETKNGRVVTIRLANHNAKISTFDNHNESDGISIVITANNNAKLTNDGNAHVTEFYYNALKLRRAEGKPLADIVRSIKQALYSGEFKDTTGLAERQEVNVGEIARQQRVYHGSANDFDAFDTMNHLSEGEGSQAFGAGTYVADQKDLGMKYANIAYDNDHNKQIAHWNGERLIKRFPTVEDFLNNPKTQEAMAKNGKTEAELRAYYDKQQKNAEAPRILYTVEIPDDNGKNYLDWDGELSRNQADTIRKRLYEAVLALNDDYKGSEMYLAQDLSVIKEGGHIGDTYGTISDYLGSDKAASEFLHDLGYTGIKVHAAHNSNDARYKDNWNYVIFNDKDLKITDKVRFFRTTNGEAYGFTVGGKIYIDPRIATSETPIHEYAHLWAEALRKVNPKEWVNVVELMKGCKEVWEQVTKEYPELETDDEIAEEVLAHYSGKRGAERLRAEAAKAADGAKSDLEKDKVKSAFSRLKDAIKKAWKHIAEDILHIHFTTAEEVADKVMYDLLNKVNPNRFNLSKSVEEGKDLIAVHNLTEDKLKQSLELGGFPMPSIAITKSSMGHAEYGDISLLFGKDTINPSDSRNKVYSGDAWTPTFPHVSYKLDEKKLRDIYSRALKAGNLPFFDSARLHPENLKDRVDGNDSAKIIESGKKDYGMKQMFLSEKGNPVKGYVQKTVDKYSPERVELLQEILDKIGVEGLRNGKYEDELKQIVGSYRHVDLDSVKPFFAKLAMQSALRDAIDFAENGNKKVENDVEATQKEIDSRIAPKEYDQWLHDMLEGITEKKGIRNNTDPYTRSGDRLKWERLYDAVTLDNVLKAMKAQPAKSGGFFNSIFGASAKELSNLNEVREEAKRRIKSVPEEEFKAEKDKILSRLEKISLPSVERSNSISGAMDFVENVKDAVVHSHTPRGIYKYLSDIYPDMTIDVANEIADVVKDIQSMSTRYLEAKPYRAVGFDEVRAAVVPSDTEAKIVQQLKDKGIPVYTYEKGNAEERRQVVNDAAQEQSVKFHKAEFGNSKKAAENEVEAVNKRFNEELEKYKRGEVPIGTRFELGMPSKALESAGFPYLPISMRASLLSKKAGMERHPFEASDLRDLVKAMQMPIAIFKYSKDNMRNLIVDVKHGDKHFLVGITLDYKAGDIEVNSVSGLFPKESHEWIKWIQDGKAIRIDQKKKVLDLIDSLRTNPAESERIGLNLSSVAKIVEDFENPVIKGENLSFEGEDGSIKDVPTTPEETEESDVLYRIADDDEAAMLDKEPTVKVYRAMQLIDGKLYPPMMAGVKGKLVEPRELGQWEVADERPDIITHTKMNKKGEEIGYVKLDKGSKTSLGKRGTPIPAAYNPYWHTSRSPLNDQFKSAWIRPNIVTVEVEIPVSELTSGYRAKYAKDPVGETDWHSGSVTKQLTAQGHAPRKVILSRYDKPVRVLSAAETAERIIDYIGDYDVTIPENVVTPQVRVELEKRGIKIGEPEKGVKKTEQIREAIERGLSVSDDMLRDVEVFEDGERLPIIWREDGISVEGLNNEYDNVGQLLDAFREKYPDYISTIYDEDGQELSPSKAYSRQSDYKHPVLIVEPWRKYLSDYTGKRAVAMRQHTQRQQERAKEAVNDWARKLNLGDKVTVITDDSKLTGKKAKAKGWFDTKSGKITIVLPKHTSIDDVVRTMLHEGVAHYGLRELFGDKFDTFLDNVWNNASVDVKGRLEKLAIKYDGNQRKATEEYLSGLAEDTDFDRAMQSGWWNKIKNFFISMLAKAGIRLKHLLTDNDLRYILWRSYQNMVHPGEYRNEAEETGDVEPIDDIDPIDVIEGRVSVAEPMPRRGSAAREHTEAEKQQMQRAAEEAGEALGGVKINVERNGHDGIKGSYNTEDDTVHVNLDEADDAEDIQATVSHEVLGHEGLKALFGSNKAVDAFGEFIYDNAGKALRKKIVERAAEEGYEWDDPLRYSKAAQEVFSDIASEGPANADEFSLWRKVKHYVIKAAKKLGLHIKGLLNDHDLRYYVLKTGKAVKTWAKMSDADKAEAAESGRIMYSRRGKPKQKKGESMAHYIQRLREYEMWKNAEQKAREANDPLPEREDFEKKAQEEFNKAMDDWRKQTGIEEGAEQPGAFPNRKDGETPQEYAIRVADYESELDKWKTAPNVFDYLKKGEDAYRQAYEDWKVRYDIQEMEDVDEKLYGEAKQEPSELESEEEHYKKMEIDAAVDKDLGDAVGVDTGVDGARRQAKLAVIERRKNLESASAEDAIFIHDLCKDIDNLAKELGMPKERLRSDLITIIEEPRQQKEGDEEVERWVEVLNKMRAFQDAHTSITADGVKAARQELSDLAHEIHNHGYKPSTGEGRQAVHDAAVRLADKLNEFYNDNPSYNKLFGDDIMQVGKYIGYLDMAASMAEESSALGEDPRVKAIVDRIHDWYDNFFHVIEDAGLRGDAGYIAEGYINHIWDKDKSDAEAWNTYVENFQRTKSANMHHRTVDTYLDGIKVGLVPKFNDVAQIMSYYSRQNNEAIANKKFLDDMSFLTISETNKDGEVTRILPVLNSHKPNKFDEERYQMYHVPGVGDVWVLKDVASRFASIFGTMRTQDIPNWLSNIGKGYDLLGSTMKKIQLSISGFHAFALTEVAIAQMGPINGVRWAAKSLPIELKPLLMLKELFKGTLIDSIKNGTIPAYAHPEDFKFAASHLVQLGATQDYAAADVNMITEKFRNYVKGLRNDEAFMKKLAGNAINPFAVALDWVNKGTDKLLWNYLHDGLKIACFKYFAEQIDRKVEKEGLTAKQRERLLDEAGQYVNDTFGGQYWELLNVSPATLKWLRRAFLSSDWLISTQRHFFANFGFGSLYDPRTFAQYLSDQLPGGKKRKAKREQAQQGDDAEPYITKPEDDGDIYRQFRSKAARLCYILGVGVYFYTMMNGINAIMRVWDKEKEKEKADEIRKTNPEYKSPYELAYPDGMKWYDYTMFGNSLGQQTHLFLGRYADGSEMYVRWGKQFREFPEMFIGSKGLDFPAPMIQRLMGKANPVIGLLRDNLGALGIWGFENQNDIADIQAKYGKTIGLLAMNARHFFPYSLPTQADKEFKMMDVFMPSQKGFTRYKTVDYFKDFIKSGDMEGVARTYRAATMNGINAEDCLKAAITTLKAEQKDEMRDGIVDVTTACAAYDKAKTLTEKKAIRNKMIKLLAAGNYKAFTRAEALQMVNDYMNGNDVAEKDNDKYIQLSTSSDVRADYRLNAIGKQAKTYADSIKNAAKRGDSQTADRLAQRYGAWLEIDALAKQERSVVNKLKKQLGHGNDRAIMNEIRQARRDFQSQIDQVQPPK